jgi:hypothetical protein
MHEVELQYIHYISARKDELLSKLALKTGNKQQSYLPKAAPTEKLYSVSDIDDEDLKLMCKSTQSGLQTDTGTSMTTSMGTSKSNGQTGTGTLMTTNTGSSKFTDTRTGTHLKTIASSFPSETGTSRLTETRSDGPTGASSQFVSG